MIKRGLTLDNATNITSRILINDDAGPEAADPEVADPEVGCTTAPVRHVPRESREQRRCALEAKRNSQCCA
jgi:hypothetical protein